MTLSQPITNGYILIDKPSGPTSMAMVRLVKRALEISQVGHLGTLDPFASGLLPILVGGATRLSDHVMDGKKAYTFSVQLGRETDTLDVQGKVISEQPVPSLSMKAVEQVLHSFLGKIEQVPPLYSAIKMDGVALYDHMRRKGSLPRDIQTKVRCVDVYTIKLLDMRPIESGLILDIFVECGKGTYVRSLARDIAKSLGTCGFCLTLRREFVEPWNVTEALSPQGLEGKDLANAICSNMRPAETLVMNYPVIRVLGDVAEKALTVGNGFALLPNELVWLRDLQNSRLKSECCVAFVSCASGLQFLSEVRLDGNNYWIQPRKKISEQMTSL